MVKAFSIYGFENFEDNPYPGHAVKPVMMFFGDDGSTGTSLWPSGHDSR